jgi:hypothetical protein
MTTSQSDFAAKVIDLLGGTIAVAQSCEVTPAAVSQWRISGIPNARLMFLRIAYPAVFAEIEGKSSGQRNRRATDSLVEGTPIDGKSVREAKGKFRIPKVDTRRIRE